MATVAQGTRETLITLASATAGPFDLGFRLFDDDTIDVFVNGVRNEDWTLSSSYANGYDDAATITFDAALEIGDEIVIQSNLTAGRAADYSAGDPRLADKMNVELARLWSSVADIQRNVARTLRGFAALDPVVGIDLESIAEAEANALAAAVSADEAAASAALATSAQENLFDAWRGAWLTATAYVEGDLVRSSGTTYICLEAHTSGTFSTDLSASKWEVFAQQGSAGAGTGDMLAANNGSDFSSLSAARANLQAAYAQAADITSTDFNGVTGSAPVSFYKVGASNTNGWPGMVAGDLLMHFNYSGTVAIQFGILRAAEPLIYMRRKAAGSWGSWFATASQTYVDAAVAAVGGGYEHITTEALSSDATAITVTGLDAYSHIRAYLIGEVIDGGSTLTFEARVSGGTWRVLSSFPGAANTTGTHLVLVEIFNFNNALANGGVRFISLQRATTQTDLDRSATEQEITADHEKVAVSFRDEVWDEIRFTTTSTFEGDDADARTTLTVEGY